MPSDTEDIRLFTEGADIKKWQETQAKKAKWKVDFLQQLTAAYPDFLGKVFNNTYRKNCFAFKKHVVESCSAETRHRLSKLSRPELQLLSISIPPGRLNSFDANFRERYVRVFVDTRGLTLEDHDDFASILQTSKTSIWTVLDFEVDETARKGDDEVRSAEGGGRSNKRNHDHIEPTHCLQASLPGSINTCENSSSLSSQQAGWPSLPTIQSQLVPPYHGEKLKDVGEEQQLSLHKRVRRGDGDAADQDLRANPPYPAPDSVQYITPRDSFGAPSAVVSFGNAHESLLARPLAQLPPIEMHNRPAHDGSTLPPMQPHPGMHTGPAPSVRMNGLTALARPGPTKGMAIYSINNCDSSPKPSLASRPLPKTIALGSFDQAKTNHTAQWKAQAISLPTEKITYLFKLSRKEPVEGLLSNALSILQAVKSSPGWHAEHASTSALEGVEFDDETIAFILDLGGFAGSVPECELEKVKSSFGTQNVEFIRHTWLVIRPHHRRAKEIIHAVF